MDCLTEVTTNCRMLIDKIKDGVPEKADTERLIQYMESLIKLAWDERDCWSESERRLIKACLERDEANKKFEELRRRCGRVIAMLDDASDLLED